MGGSGADPEVGPEANPGEGPDKFRAPATNSPHPWLLKLQHGVVPRPQEHVDPSHGSTPGNAVQH